MKNRQVVPKAGLNKAYEKSIVNQYEVCRIRQIVTYHAPYTHPDFKTETESKHSKGVGSASWGSNPSCISNHPGDHPDDITLSVYYTPVSGMGLLP